MPNSKQIVYLSQTQYAELITNGTITVDGVTVTYDENDIYVTPQAEPVTDVRVNNVSVAANGVANIPTGSAAQFGVMRAGGPTFGVTANNGIIAVSGADSSQVKAGGGAYLPITTLHQHEATFYGLAKASGDITQGSSSNSVGSYTPEAKGAIQQMLGVSDLIATAENNLVASKAYAIGDVFTANGKLYKATAAIAANDTIVLQNEGETISGANAVEVKLGDYAVHDVQVNGISMVNNGVANLPMITSTTPGIAKVDQYSAYGINVRADGTLQVVTASDAQVKSGSAGNDHRPITPSNQHASTFYGLAKAAGDTTQSQSDNAVGIYTDAAKAAIRTMLGAGEGDVKDVQVNGESIVSNNVANIPYAGGSTGGVVKVGSAGGLYINPNNGVLQVSGANASNIKTGTDSFKAITPSGQHQSVFYGLAKAAGDTTQSSSSNAVGVYTDNAKASIKAMLGIQDGSTGTVDVSGATPTITAVENTRYVCGEVTSLNFTPAASGICIVRFTSGSTVTVLTIPSTVKFPEWFDPASLETNTIYEICVTDGVYGAVMSWAL